MSSGTREESIVLEDEPRIYNLLLAGSLFPCDLNSSMDQRKMDQSIGGRTELASRWWSRPGVHVTHSAMLSQNKDEKPWVDLDDV